MLLVKIVLFIINFLFLVIGGCLVGLGLYIVVNDELDKGFRLVPTSLPASFTYYTSISIAALGLIIAALSLLAFFAVASLNKYLLTTYIFGIFVLLISECTTVLFLYATPKYIGIHIDTETLVDSWQRNYGVPGRELYTASVDSVQTEWGCCGVESGLEYGTSWWTLRELAPQGLVVPLSCCIQGDKKSYSDPTPVNLTLCQDKNPENHRFGRYTEGCLSYLTDWMSCKVEFITYIIGGLILYQLTLLYVAIFACIKLSGIKPL